MLYLCIGLGAFLLFILVLVLLGLKQPTVATTSKTLIINRPLETVFEQCVSLRKFVVWSPWTIKDPKMEVSFSDEDGTVGSWYKWKGNRKVGMGKMTILEIVPNKSITIELSFGFRSKSTAIFNFEESGSGTIVTWSFESEIGKNPLKRAMIPAMNKYIGGDFELGLQNLKKHCND